MLLVWASAILATQGSRDMGRTFSGLIGSSEGFFNKGITLACFQGKGITAVVKEALMTWRKGLSSTGKESLNWAGLMGSKGEPNLTFILSVRNSSWEMRGIAAKVAVEGGAKGAMGSIGDIGKDL